MHISRRLKPAEDAETLWYNATRQTLSPGTLPGLGSADKGVAWKTWLYLTKAKACY